MQKLIEPPRTTITSPLYKYTEANTKVLLRGLSLGRLNRYSKLAPNNKIKQLKLYVWNTELSESLYTPIQGLEVITRNYFNSTLIKFFGEKWYESSQIRFTYAQMHSLIQARENLQKEGKSLTADNLVAILSFGFWTGLLGSKYETSLWRTCLYKAFINKPSPFLRKNAHHEFDLIRILRNRIAHHEPILRQDLPHHYLRILKMIEWFCEETAGWINAQSRFTAVWYKDVNPFLSGNDL